MVSGSLLTTPAEAAVEIPDLRFAFYTDIHTRTEWETPTAILKAAERINAESPEFVIAGGDLITDGFESSAETVAPRWDAYMTMHNKINTPIYPVLGNHDLVAVRPKDHSPISENPRALFLQKMKREKTWYTFDQNQYRFIVLDSVSINDGAGGGSPYKGYVNEEQIEWLRELVAATPKDQPIVLVTHIPLLTSFYMATRGATAPAPSHRVIGNNKEVLKCFAEHNLILVLQGHLHVNEKIVWKGTTFITGGAVCAKWWRGNWHGTDEGFGIVSLKNNEITWKYVNYGWETKRPKNL